MRLASVHTYPIKGGYRLDHDAARVQPWGLAGDRRWMIVDDDRVGVTQRDISALVALRPEPRTGGIVLRAAGRPALDLPEPTNGEPVAVRVFGNQPAVPARSAGPAAADWLTALLNHRVRLVWLGDPTKRVIPDSTFAEPDDPVSFADSFPVLLANLASLDALNGWLLDSGNPEGPLPMTRFRPNLVIDGAEPWAEDNWSGRRLRIGAVSFRAAGPCGRCVVTTVDQQTGESGHEPLRVLAKHRNIDRQLCFGLFLVPDVACLTDGASAAHPGPEARPGWIAVDDPIELLA